MERVVAVLGALGLGKKGVCFSNTFIAGLKQGAPFWAGIEHKNYCFANDPLPNATRAALLGDFD